MLQLYTNDLFIKADGTADEVGCLKEIMEKRAYV